MTKELGPQGIRMNAVAPGAIRNADAPRKAELEDLFVAQTALGHIEQHNDITQAV